MGLAERISGKLHCLDCGRLYQRRDLLFVGVGKDELDLYMRCHACGSYLHLTVPEGNRSSRVFTASLAPQNVARGENKDESVVPVSAEDVLVMREFLSKFDGDVERLLGSPCDGP